MSFKVFFLLQQNSGVIIFRTTSTKTGMEQTAFVRQFSSGWFRFHSPNVVEMHGLRVLF